MTTKQQMIKIIKAENPTLQIGDDNTGYTQLSTDEYEATISQWADARLAKETQALEVETKATAKAALLTQLGITEEQAKLLLS
jgi:hypothetical protein